MTLLSLQSVRLLPNGVFDDPQLGHINALPLLTRVWARQSFACIGVLHHPDLVPDNTASIELIEDKPRPALGVAVDRRRIPSPTSRWMDIFPIEVLRNLPGRPSRCICCKDPSDDRSFIFNDFELAGFARYRSISVGAPSRMSAIAYHAGHAAADLLRAVLALHLSDEAPDPNQDRVRGAIVDGLDLDPWKDNLLCMPARSSMSRESRSNASTITTENRA
jgi:hypothetical protein